MCVYALNIYIQEACTPVKDVSLRKLTCNDWYNWSKSLNLARWDDSSILKAIFNQTQLFFQI